MFTSVLQKYCSKKKKTPWRNVKFVLVKVQHILFRTGWLQDSNIFPNTFSLGSYSSLLDLLHADKKTLPTCAGIYPQNLSWNPIPCYTSLGSNKW